MKGLELPINIIIVIAIAVLVLVVISAFFAGQFGSGVNNMQLESSFNSACATWKSSYSCADEQSARSIYTAFKFPSPNGGEASPANLAELCEYKTTGRQSGGAGFSLVTCQRACGCI